MVSGQVGWRVGWFMGKKGDDKSNWVGREELGVFCGQVKLDLVAVTFIRSYSPFCNLIKTLGSLQTCTSKLIGA